MSPRKKQKKLLVEESSDEEWVEPPSNPDDDWLKNSSSKPNYFDTLPDSDDEDIGVQNLNNVADDKIVALPTSSHSNLLQFLHKQNAEVQKELSEGKCMIWNFKLDINI